MPTITPIDQYAGSINFTIPPEYEAIKERVYSEIPTGDRLANKNEIIREVGIAAGVKGMVYTDALEEERMPPGDVQKEIGLICHNDIWELGEKYKLSPQEMRQAWKQALATISEIVRASYDAHQVANLQPINPRDFNFHPGPDEDEPLESEGEA